MLAAHALHLAMTPPTGFGQSMHHHSLHPDYSGELTIFEHAVNAPSAMTYFWMTCGGSDGSFCFNLYSSLFRFYVDGEEESSLTLPYGLAHGAGGAWEGPLQNEPRGRCVHGDCAAYGHKDRTRG